MDPFRRMESRALMLGAAAASAFKALNSQQQQDLVNFLNTI